MLKVKFNTTDYERIMNALRKLEVLAPVIVQDDMQRWCATDLYQLVFSNIVTRKYTGSDPQYHPRYAKWKMENVGHLHPWLLKGDLLESLSAFKSQSGWMGGIPAGVKDSGGKSWKGPIGSGGKSKTIAMYARKVEFGGRVPRPVFTPTTQEYANDGWKNRGREALRETGNLWR
jgi:hypothetical protein